MYIPEINLVKRPVQARKDRRFGVDDFTLWPQLYCDQYPHSAVVWKCPDNPNDPRTLWWWTPTQADFVPSNDGAIPGLGRLRLDMMAVFHEEKGKLSEQIRIYLDTHQVSMKSPLQMASTALSHIFSQMKFCLAMFRKIVLAIAEFQRSYLDARAYLDYYRVFADRFVAPEPLPVDETRIGVWTIHLKIVQQMYQAWIPVWFVREDIHFPPDGIIHTIVRERLLRSVGVELDDWVEKINESTSVKKPFPVIGDYMPGPQIHESIRHRSLVYVDSGQSRQLVIAVPALHHINIKGAASAVSERVPRV
jgi:hypothetical protein